MKFYVFLFLISFISSAKATREGHGGDIYNCVDTPSLNDFKGDYTLDFLLTETEDNPGGVVFKGTLTEYIDYFRALIRSKNPDLLIDFEGFVETLPIEGYAMMSNDYVWQTGAGSLFNIPDEQMNREVPSNCHFKSQAVIKNGVIYDFDRWVFTTLPASKPRQMSYLIIHEWLRNYIKSSKKIRLVNSFLHQVGSAQMIPNDFILRFSTLAHVGKDRLNSYARERALHRMSQLIEQNDLVKIVRYLQINPNLLVENYFSNLDYLLDNHYLSQFNSVYSLLSNEHANKVFSHLIQQKKYSLLKGLDRKVDISEQRGQRIAYQCIRDNSQKCFDVLVSNNVQLNSIVLDFLPSYRGGNNYSEYGNYGLGFDRDAMGSFQTSKSKHYEVVNASLLVFAAIEGRIDLINRLLETDSFPKKVEVRVKKNYFQGITNCLNCSMTVKLTEKPLIKILELKRESLKFHKRSADETLALEIEEWIEQIELIINSYLN